MGSGSANVMLPQRLPRTKKSASSGQGALFLLGLPTAESRSSRDTPGHGPPGASVHKSPLQGVCCERYDCFSGEQWACFLFSAALCGVWGLVS